MENINLNKLDIDKFITKDEYNNVKKEVLKSFDVLNSRNGEGNDFLGWLDLPINYDKEEFVRIEKAAKRIRENSKVLVSIGIGGSYLGARATIETFKKYFNNEEFEVIFVGNQISSTYLYELTEYLNNKDYSINVISKSGTTTEPAIAFRVLQKHLVEKYGKEEAKKEFLRLLIKKKVL